MLTSNQELALAIKLAAEGHIDQTDKGGKPYILHPLKVMHYLKTHDMQLMAIAIMHDLVDDCDVSLDDLREHGFSDRVIEGVWLLSNVEGLPYEDYIQRMLYSQDAMRVKLADLRHNADIRRLKGLTDKDLLRMRKYHSMHVKLTETLKQFEE